MAVSKEKLEELRAKARANGAKALAAEKEKEVAAATGTAVAVVSAPVAALPVAAPVTPSVPVVLEDPTEAAVIPQPEIELTPQQYVVFEKIAAIDSMLKTNDPRMERLLKEVHTALHKDPELVHFLKPEQIGAVVQGCMEVTKIVVIATAVKKATGASTKKLKNTTLADI